MKRNELALMIGLLALVARFGSGFERVPPAEVLANSQGDGSFAADEAVGTLLVYVHPGMCRALLKEKETWEKVISEFGPHRFNVLVIIDDAFGSDEASGFGQRYLKGLPWRVDKNGFLRERLGARLALVPLKAIVDRDGNLMYYDVKCTDREERQTLFAQVRKVVLQLVAMSTGRGK